MGQLNVQGGNFFLILPLILKTVQERPVLQWNTELIDGRPIHVGSSDLK